MRVGERFVLALVLLVIFSGLLVPAAAQSSQHLFGLSANRGIIAREPWPVVAFNGGLRLWNTNTTWSDINTATGVYDWTTLDEWLAKANANGTDDVLYTFGSVPPWASSNPDDPICHPSPGTCDPPNDLNPDGSGSDQHWKEFVTAIATHSKNSSTAHIRYWEMWNEPHNNFYWNGTYAQLVRMASDAYTIIKSIDSKALVSTPSFGWTEKFYLNYMAGYLAAGGGKYADRMAVHGYVLGPRHTYRDPENLVPDCAAYRAVMHQYALDAVPIWNTEGNWGGKLGFHDHDMQAAWIARYFLLTHSMGIRRMYWFLWNGGDLGGLWARNPSDPTKGTLLKPGIAYAELSKWMVGAVMNKRCSSTGTVWTCGFARANGYEALAVWDTSQTCSGGNCTTSPYEFNGDYLNYRDLAGGTNPIHGKTVPIGAKPILLQNQ